MTQAKGYGKYLNVAASKIQMAWFPTTDEDKKRDWRTEGAWKAGLEFPDGGHQYAGDYPRQRRVPAEKMVPVIFGETATPFEEVDGESFSTSYVEDVNRLFLLDVTEDGAFLFHPEQKRFLRGDFYPTYQCFADDLQNKEGVIRNDMTVLVTPHLLRCYQQTFGSPKDRRWEGQLWTESYLFED